MKKNKILFVDDEEVMRKLAGRLLAGSYELSLASGVREALETISGGQLDLLVTDWRLQDGDGAAVVKAFREKFPGAPCILITGFMDTDEFLKQAAGLQFTQRFQKPFNVMEFLEAVRKALAPAEGAETEPGK